MAFLVRGETIEVEGVLVRIDGDGEIDIGDSFAGERNRGLELLIVKRIDARLGLVFPTSSDYPYDISKCVKVREA
ncbi:MAG: hypothetical protein Q7S36_02465 [Candidatus Liptonbacteria bacterium]|nr:hypothetical protein [Candidatus Liptonbacteria bacterium]